MLFFQGLLLRVLIIMCAFAAANVGIALARELTIHCQRAT